MGFGYGFYLWTLTDCSFSENVAHDNPQYGFYIRDSMHLSLCSNTATENLKDGFYITDSSYLTLDNNTATENLEDGFRLDSVVGSILRENNASYNSGPSSYDAGFHLQDASGCTLEYNYATYNYAMNFNLDHLDSCILTDNVATGWSYPRSNGFSLSYSYDCTLTNNMVITPNAEAFSFDHAFLCTLVNNSAISGATTGFVFVYSCDNTLIGNIATDNANYGIGFDYSHNCTIKENIVTGSQYGMSLGYCTNMILFHNWIGPNTINAQDSYSLGVNIWDDDISQGNHWSNYNGSGVYTISGPSGSVDRFPFGMGPHVDHPADIINIEGTTGHYVVWHPASLHPLMYELYIDTGTGLLYNTGPWDGSAFSAPIDGLVLGHYSYTLIVYDTSSRSASDIVLITVVDETAPSIDSPADLIYEAGTIGHNIVWTAQDQHLGTYTILRDLIPVSGVRNGNNITVSVDGLALGVYNYTLVMNDTSGNSARDTVFITVVDSTAPTIDRPADISYELGTVGHNLVWLPLDLNPASCIILKDGDVEMAGDWNGSAITISIDGLALGLHNYTIVVYDISGNSVSDQVMVLVSPAATTTTTSTTATTTSTNETSSGLSSSILVTAMIAGEGAAIVILIVILFLRRRT
jgi:parallel beta-helix repeat protein